MFFDFFEKVIFQLLRKTKRRSWVLIDEMTLSKFMMHEFQKPDSTTGKVSNNKEAP